MPNSPDSLDPYGLERFVQAQGPVIAQVRAELEAGRKASHWMWFVFPQLAGLGRSEIARHYGIASGKEAVAYLAHPVLGPRLQACTRLVLAIEGRTARAIFGTPDDLKLHSSMTLFASVHPGASAFRDVLDKYFDGAADPLTTAALDR